MKYGARWLFGPGSGTGSVSANVSANVSATCPTTATTTKTQPPVQAQFIGTGSTHACAVSAEHNAVCWGNGDDGKTTTPGATVASITVGLNNACAITLADSTATCWGSNGHQMSELAPSGFGRFDSDIRGREARMRHTGGLHCGLLGEEWQ